MNVLLIESSSGGHYVSLHLKSIIENFNKKNICLYFLISKDTLKSENFKKIKGINKKNIFLFNKPKEPIIKNKIFFFLNQIIYYFKLKSAFKKIEKKIDFIHINTLDHFDKALAIFNSPFKNIPFSGQLNHPTFHLNKMNIKSIKKYNLLNLIFFNFLIKTKNLKTIFTIDPLLRKYMKKQKKSYANSITTLPVTANLNVSSGKNSLNKIFKNKAFYILVYGAIRESKNILKLFKSVNNLKYQNIKIIIGGKIDKNFKKKIIDNIKLNKKLNTRVLIFDRYLNEIETTVLFKKSNAIWLCYKEEHFTSSSVFFKSGMNNKKVIACNHGLIKYFNRILNLGPEIDPNDDNQILNGLKMIYQNKYKYNINTNYFNKNNNPNLIGKLIVSDTLKFI
ncbi:glycosyltransferase [Pelagibacterales bacterium SAG-MED14]|nr:glycosyltransferase [Pelagibacterales bacterium SAG-MED14]